MSYPTQLTPIAQLATYYPDSFELTILFEELNGFGTPELVIEIDHVLHTNTYRINKPVGKRWREANPKLNTKYLAEIEHYIPSNRHFMSIISEASKPIQITTITDYVTSYTNLPFEGKLVVACHVWDTSVEFPSMLIRERTKPTIYRVAVPTNLISKIHEIHNKYIVINVRKGDQKSRLKLVNIGDSLLQSDITNFETYKPNTISQPTNLTPIENIVESMLNEPIIEIGSIWNHNEHPYQATVMSKSPSEYGDVIWLYGNCRPESDGPLCIPVFDFTKHYTLVELEKPAEFKWDNHYIHHDGVLCRNIETNEITILYKNDYLGEFVPLTKLEAMNLVYNDDEIPF